LVSGYADASAMPLRKRSAYRAALSTSLLLDELPER
jgi:hypothetical protein